MKGITNVAGAGMRKSDHLSRRVGATDRAQSVHLKRLLLALQTLPACDRGYSTVAAMQDSQISAIYRSIARKTAARLANKGRDHSSAFPNIVIQNT